MLIVETMELDIGHVWRYFLTSNKLLKILQFETMNRLTIFLLLAFCNLSGNFARYLKYQLLVSLGCYSIWFVRGNYLVFFTEYL